MRNCIGENRASPKGFKIPRDVLQGQTVVSTVMRTKKEHFPTHMRDRKECRKAEN